MSTRKRPTYRNSTLDRTYGGLVRASATDAEDQRLRVEYAALERCYRVYVSSGMTRISGDLLVNPAIVRETQFWGTWR